MKNLILIGMPATFKSSAGIVAARKLGFDFVDTDGIIEAEEKKSISEIFLEFGEGYFRQLENKLAHRLAKSENKLISCGGGFVLNPDNMLVLKKSGVVCWLRADIDSIVERVTQRPNKRPLLNTPDIRQKLTDLLETREPLYSRYCDFEVDTSGITSLEVGERIVGGIERFYVS